MARPPCPLTTLMPRHPQEQEARCTDITPSRTLSGDTHLSQQRGHTALKTLQSDQQPEHTCPAPTQKFSRTLSSENPWSDGGQARPGRGLDPGPRHHVRDTAGCAGFRGACRSPLCFHDLTHAPAPVCRCSQDFTLNFPGGVGFHPKLNAA